MRYAGTMAFYSSDFARAFDSLLKKTGVSCYAIQKLTGIDEGYLSCLRSGKKGNPSPEIIIKIAIAVANLSTRDEDILYDIENLFNAVGRSIFTAR